MFKVIASASKMKFIAISAATLALGLNFGLRPAGADPGNSKSSGLAQFYAQRATTSDGKPVTPATYDEIARQWQKIPLAAQPKNGKAMVPLAGVKGSTWKAMGPSGYAGGGGAEPDEKRFDPSLLDDTTVNIDNGRVNTIAIHPFNPNIIYLGAPMGGVWRTDDAGKNWRTLFDQQLSLGIGEPNAIAIDPLNPNTIYVGTSRRSTNESLPFTSDAGMSRGIMKSTDGGGIWFTLGSGFPADNVGNAQATFALHNVGAIIVDPSDSNIVYAADEIGFYRSTDGGKNFTKSLDINGDVTSLVLDPTSPAGNRIMYAGVGRQGVFMSTNSGQNWTQILDKNSPDVATELAARQAAEVGAGAASIGERVAVVLAPPTSPANGAGIQVLYVAMNLKLQNIDLFVKDFFGVFRSTDQGANWTIRANQAALTSNVHTTYNGYVCQLGVDPASPGDGSNDTLYVATVGTAKSTDSGANWSNVTNGIHADCHAPFAFVKQPATPSILYAGNDGGIWRTTDGGANWTGTAANGGSLTTINEGGLQIAQFNRMDVAPNSANTDAFGCLQDNGILFFTGGVRWDESLGGDAFDVAYNSVSDALGVNNGGSNGVGVFPSTDGGHSFGGDLVSGLPASEKGTFRRRYLGVDKNNVMNWFYRGDTTLYRTMNGGGSLPSIRTFTGDGSLAVSAVDANRVVVADNGSGSVFASTNALAGSPTFTDITRDLPSITINDVEFDASNPDEVYAVAGSVGSKTVFKTTISGSAWDDISPPLTGPVNAIALDGGTVPSTIYIGSDVGVLRSVDHGASWAKLDDAHFPNAPVTSLVINKQANKLWAATFARGVFLLDAPTNPTIAVNPENGFDFGFVCAGSCTNLLLQVFNVGPEDLEIASVQNVLGSADFTVLPNPATPLTIGPFGEVDFTVRYCPTNTPGPDAEQATIRIVSNDPTAPTFDVTATGTRIWPNIGTTLENSGEFGDVCRSSQKNLSLFVDNNGSCPLTISNVARISGDSEFTVSSVVVFPITVAPGTQTALPLTFAPTDVTAYGSHLATFRISSNDPDEPTRDFTVGGFVPPPDIATSMEAGGNFGNVCRESQESLTMQILNQGECTLHVASITRSAGDPEFTVASVLSFPVAVEPGNGIELPITFAPTAVTAFGPHSATFSISSDDPDENPALVNVTANVPPPKIDVNPCPLDFGTICAEDIAGHEKEVNICNIGLCPLIITNIELVDAFNNPSPDFKIDGTLSFPININGGSDCYKLFIKFTPTSIGPKLATLRITSNDPTNSVFTCTVSGSTPTNVVTVPQRIAFQPTVITADGPCVSEQALNIVNSGACITSVTAITVTGPDAEAFSFDTIETNSLPIALTPGELLNDGDLKLLFHPAVIVTKRFYQAQVNVTFVVDPFTGLTNTLVIPVAGEAVQTGMRILVTKGGTALSTVQSIQVRGSTRGQTGYTLNNVPLKHVDGPAGFEDVLSFDFHAEFGGLSAPTQRLTGNYRITVVIRDGRKQLRRSINFNADTCTFNPTLNINF